MQLKLLAKFHAAFILKPTEGNLIAPFLDRIVQKQRRETRKEELEITSACQRNMRSREPYVARASEDERKETDAHANRGSRLLHSPLVCHACRHAHFPYGFLSKRETARSLWPS